MLINSPNISGSLTVTGNSVMTGSLTVLGTGSIRNSLIVDNTDPTTQGNSSTGAFYIRGSVFYNSVLYPSLWRQQLENIGFITGTSDLAWSTSANGGAYAEKMRLNSSGNLMVGTTSDTGQRLQVSGNTRLSGSFTVIATGSAVEFQVINTGVTLGNISTDVHNATGSFNVSGSARFNGNTVVTGSLTVTGQVVAQTLNVQQITSSIIYSSGSNIFGNSLANTQQFTGSVSMTGSLTVNTSGTEFQVTNTGVNIGNTLTDSHIISGSLRVNPNGLFVSGSGIVGVGTILPSERFEVNTGQGARAGMALTGEYPYLRFNVSSSSANARNWAFNATNAEPGDFALLQSTAKDGNPVTAGTSILGFGRNGAATFSSSVTATSLILNGSDNTIITQIKGASGMLQVYPYLTAADGPIIQALDLAAANFKNLRIECIATTIKAPNSAVTDGSAANINLHTTTAYGANIGGTIGLGGLFNGSASTEFVVIAGKKENATINNLAGYLAFYTRGALTDPIERMRITSTGNVSIGNTNNTYKLDVTGQIKSTQYLIAPDGTNNVYHLVDATSTYTGLYTIQAGGGSAGFGGSISMYGHSHATKPGYVNIGISASSNGKFTVTNQANASGTEIFVVQQNGFVGIGITPSYLLHIPQNNNIFLSNLYITGTANNPVLSSGATGGSMSLEGGGAEQGKIYLQGAGSGGNGYIEFSAGGSLRMTISDNGSIGAPSGTNIYNPSDLRLKRNISTISNGLDKISALNPIKFNWIDGFEPSEDGKDMLGFVAQEVYEVIPEAVESFSGNSILVNDIEIENPLRINEKFILPVLVKAIQELKAENDTLKSRIDTLEQA